jgi:hypothetical protein
VRATDVYIFFLKEILNEQEEIMSDINQYIVNICKSDSLLINDYLFNPKITKYVNTICIYAYLNFPYNWKSWNLPKFLLEKDCKISFFDKTKIVVSYR